MVAANFVLLVVVLGLALGAAEAALNANSATVNLVKGFEGWRSCWYKDAAGYPTIGYGHLIKSGDPYQQGSCLTTSEGEALLKHDMQSAVSCINRIVKVNLSCNEFGALASWAFNVGCGNAGSSTLVRVLNEGQKSQVCSELAKWNKAGGKPLQGLTNRREAECNFFRAGGGSGC